MASIEQDIEVGVPVRVAYDQWTQFEESPRFMEGVEEVDQLAIAWESEEGARNAGRVSFEDLGDETTRIRLRIEYEPEDVVESAGGTLEFVSRRIEGDLKLFDEFIEARGVETGGWPGTIR